MGHYDSCRGYCRCGRHESEAPDNCGNKNCSKYISWLQVNRPAEYEILNAERERREEKAAIERIKRRKAEKREDARRAETQKQREKLRESARTKLTPAERKALNFE